MKRNRFVLFTTLVVLLALSVSGWCAGVKYKASGTYADSSSAQHSWVISDAHTLVWDGEPYLPVGSVFVPRSIAVGAAQGSYDADVNALAAMKAKGITDVVLKGNGPITSGDPAAWQKIISYLDNNGFTYGVEMDDGPSQPLSGYLISPNRYRLEGPKLQTVVSCDWPDVDSAIYAVVNTFDNSIKASGGAVMKDGKLQITLRDPLATGQVLVVYPHKTFKPIEEGGVGDIWSGFGDYRDRVLVFFKKIKFGRGLRFFLEPYTSKMDFADDMIGFVPDTSGFRLGLEAYLTKKRIHEGAVNTAWGLQENLASIEVAARLIPLWSANRGLSFAYDRASAHFYPVDVTTTQLWQDLTDYRDSSAQEYMNTISDVLKRNVADVPVIFKNSKYQRIYANPFGMAGFDGLAVDAVGTGYVPVEKSAGPAYSLAEESGKTTWFIVSGTRSSAAPRSAAGYSDEKSMSTTLELLRTVGCKGFFVDGTVGEPNQLDWLKSFKDKTRGASAANYKVNVISFPQYPATGAYVKQLAPDTWWLPTLRLGKTTYIGDGLQLYTLAGEERSYIWSSVGDRTITLKSVGADYPSIEFPPSVTMTKQAPPKQPKQKQPRGTKTKNKQVAALFSFTLTDVPVVLRGMDSSLIFPQETANLEVQRLADLIPAADKAGVDVKEARSSLSNAKLVLSNGQPVTAYGMASSSIQTLLSTLGSDRWIEGEASQANNFDGAQAVSGSSGGLALVLDTDEDPPLTPYTAAYIIDAPTNSSYEVWIAATPPADGSAMTYNMDDGPYSPVAAAGDKLFSYASGLSWYKIATSNLFPGKHTLKLRAATRRSQDNRYYFAIDAIVFSPRGFKPNGVVKPY